MAAITNYADIILQGYTPRYIRSARTIYKTGSPPWTNLVPGVLPTNEVVISVPGSATDPLGVPATLFSASTVLAEHYVGLATKSVSAVPTMAQSTIYVRSDGTNFKLRVYLQLLDSSSVIKASAYVTIQTSNGQVLDTSIPSAFTGVSYGVTNIASGWFKVTLKLTGDVAGTGSSIFRAFWSILNSSNQLTYSGDGSSGFYGYAPEFFVGEQPDEVLNDLWTDSTAGTTSIWNGYKWVPYGGGSGVAGAQVGVNLKDSAGNLITGEIKNSAINVTTSGVVTGTGSGTVTLSLPALNGVLAYSQIGNIIDATKFASGIEPITLVNIIPIVKSTNTIFNTANNKLYRWNSTTGVYDAGVPGADITGIINPASIADGSLAGTKFASGIEPIGVVSSLPGSKTTSTIFLTSDSKLYRWNGSQYTRATDGADIIANSIAAGAIVSGSITTTQLQAGGINADRLVVGSITTDRMSANSINADRLLANSITTGKIAAGAITADQIAASAITTNKLLVKSTGNALNADPNTVDITAWYIDGTNTLALVDDHTSPTGTGKALRCTRTDSSTSGVFRSLAVTNINRNKNYQARIWVRQISGATVHYLTIYFFDINGNIVNGGTGWGAGSFNYFGNYNQVPSSTWTEFVVNFGPNSAASIPANAVGCYIGALPNYGGVGVQDYAGIKICERISGDLVVEGSITSVQMDTKGLIVRDTNGNPILGVGNVLPIAYAPEATKNGNISISELGVLNGAGGGQVTTMAIVDNDRYSNRPPSAYNVGTIREFKMSTSIGLSSGPSYWCTLETIKQYVQNQAGYPGYQYAYQGPLTWRRRSVDDAGSGWTAWVQDLDREAYTGDLDATKDLNLVASGAGVSVRGSTIIANGVSGWNTAQVYSNNSYVNGAVTECVPDSTGQSMFALNSDPQSDAHYVSLDYAIYFEGANFYVFESSYNRYGPVAFNPNSDIFTIIYDGMQVRYLRNGVIFRSLSVAPNQRLYFDSSFAGSTKLDKVKFLPYASSGLTKNLQDTSWWSVGKSLSENTWVPIYGASNVFTMGTSPSGNNEVLLRVYSTSDSSGGNGGWENSNIMEVDPNKTYRFILPIYRETGASGTVYWGIQVNTVCTLNTTSPHGNPYFVYSPLTPGRWYLYVGYVFPYGSTSNTNDGAGIYDMLTGQKISAGDNWNWSNTTRYTTTRAYQYDSNYGSVTWFGKPQVELVDGSETNLSALLASGSVSARNPISASNSNLLVFDGAIKANHISVNSLSALTANLGYVTAGEIHGGYFTTGAYGAAYAWPAAGQSGVHLSSTGLLMGNANNGKYFQVTADGNIYAPQFSVENGNATFSGSLNVVSGSSGQPRTTITNSGLRVYNAAGVEVITLGIF